MTLASPMFVRLEGECSTHDGLVGSSIRNLHCRAAEALEGCYRSSLKPTRLLKPS
jgi:hypothetical protein